MIGFDSDLEILLRSLLITQDPSLRANPATTLEK